jgi:hypothetical protein
MDSGDERRPGVENSVTDIAVFSVALACAAFALGLQVGLQERPACPHQLQDGRRLVRSNLERPVECIYEMPRRRVR